VRERPPLPPGPYLVVGLARSGVAAALALRAARPDERIVACDTGRPAEAERLARAGVEVHLDTDGVHLLQASPPPATVIKSPGVPGDAPVVAGAGEAGIGVIGELELGWRLVPNEFIAVTGTNGKTTTVELIGAMHRAGGAAVAVAGNVGTPLSSLAGHIEPGATVVCEVSSFQLEDTIAFEPEVAVLLNIDPDHLDRHASLAEYRDAKLRIFANQKPPDVAFVGPGIDVPPLNVRTVWFGDASDPIDAESTRMRGPHHMVNAKAAVHVCLERGIDPGAISRTLREFPGLPHRMEHIADVAGVEYVNDSKATNVSAAVGAIESFARGVHAILGGSLKGDGFAGLAPAVAARCRSCYLIGAAAERIAEDLDGTEVELLRCGNLARAVHEAHRRAEPGDVVLLSPACASFDQYRDFEERGEHFRALVRELE
jgi:UDP-N-acetylmuramoylalanine--D-glutamate ligase